MPNKIQITIPKPCHENWENMDITERGRFCQQCQKNVFDLSQKSDADVVRFMAEHQNSACIRLHPLQLQRPLVDRPNQGFSWRSIPLAIGTFLGIAAGSDALAQSEVPNTPFEQTETTNVSVISETEATIASDSLVVKGTVVDSADGRPLDYAEVVIRSGASSGAGALTDTAGKFEIELPGDLDLQSVTIEITYIGYSKYTDTISLDWPKGTMELDTIRMKMDSKIIMSVGYAVVIPHELEEPAHPGRAKVKRFFRRIFRQSSRDSSRKLNNGPNPEE